MKEQYVRSTRRSTALMKIKTDLCKFIVLLSWAVVGLSLFVGALLIAAIMSGYSITVVLEPITNLSRDLTNLLSIQVFGGTVITTLGLLSYRVTRI